MIITFDISNSTLNRRDTLVLNNIAVKGIIKILLEELTYLILYNF